MNRGILVESVNQRVTQQVIIAGRQSGRSNTLRDRQENEATLRSIASLKDVKRPLHQFQNPPQLLTVPIKKNKSNIQAHKISSLTRTSKVVECSVDMRGLSIEVVNMENSFSVQSCMS